MIIVRQDQAIYFFVLGWLLFVCCRPRRQGRVSSYAVLTAFLFRREKMTDHFNFMRNAYCGKENILCLVFSALTWCARFLSSGREINFLFYHRGDFVSVRSYLHYLEYIPAMRILCICEGCSPNFFSGEKI